MGSYSTKFILHRHDSLGAAKLHYDLRILQPNTNRLVSFALPKARIPKLGEKVLAIKVQDHSKYFLFIDHMNIEKGFHGHGTLEYLQKGSMNIFGFGPTAITFSVNGDSPYLSGRYSLIKFADKKNKTPQDTWILLKKSDTP